MIGPLIRAGAATAQAARQTNARDIAGCFLMSREIRWVEKQTHTHAHTTVARS